MNCSRARDPPRLCGQYQVIDQSPQWAHDRRRLTVLSLNRPVAAGRRHGRAARFEPHGIDSGLLDSELSARMVVLDLEPGTNVGIQQLKAFGVGVVGDVSGLDDQRDRVGLDPGVVVGVRLSRPAGDGVDRVG